jgi:hypothetical protein
MILLIYAPPHDMSIERARPNAEPSVPITGHQGNVRLRSTQSSGTVDEEQSQEIPAETHEGNEAYRDEPDISVRIVCIPKHGTLATCLAMDALNGLTNLSLLSPLDFLK